MKPQIRLVVERPDGRRSSIEIVGDSVTKDMLDSAEDLLHTITTGERPIIKNLYDIVARAFGTTRDDAKERIIGAAYGKKSALPDPMLIGWTWKAHLDQLHADVHASRWLNVARTLTLMLRHAIDQIGQSVKADGS